MTGLKWQFRGSKEPTYLSDTRLSFGSNKGLSHFHRLSHAVKRCMAAEEWQMCLLTQMIFVGSKIKRGVSEMIMCTINFLRKLGFNIS